MIYHPTNLPMEQHRCTACRRLVPEDCAGLCPFEHTKKQIQHGIDNLESTSGGPMLANCPEFKVADKQLNWKGPGSLSATRKYARAQKLLDEAAALEHLLRAPTYRKVVWSADSLPCAPARVAR